MTSNSPARPLSGRTILVTRASGQASDLVDALSEAGATVEHFAAITIAPPPSWDSLDLVIDDPRRWHWLIFTSTNGVDSFFDRLRARGKGPDDLAGVSIAAVWKATAAALRGRGVEPDIIPRKAQATEILPLLPAEQQGVRTAVVRALEGRDELLDELRARGGDVHLAVAYQTAGAPVLPDNLCERLASQAFDAVTFASPSTAESLFRLLPAGQRERVLLSTLAVSIGPVTTAALKALGVATIIEAGEPSVASLRDAIILRLGAGLKP